MYDRRPALAMRYKQLRHVRRGSAATVWCQRLADVADPDLGRLNWAESRDRLRISDNVEDAVSGIVPSLRVPESGLDALHLSQLQETRAIGGRRCPNRPTQRRLDPGGGRLTLSAPISSENFCADQAGGEISESSSKEEDRQASDGEETADALAPASRGGGPDLEYFGEQAALFTSPFLLVAPASPRVHRR
jgi:hypothetical protein